MRRLELTDIARDDLKSIRRYLQRTWGPERTLQYLAGLRETMNGWSAELLRLFGAGALLLLRSICWATVAAACLTALFVWLASKEMPQSPEVGRSLFMIMWGLAFVPSLAAELLNAHLGAELGAERPPAGD